jgi:hypothetical protein
VAIGVCDLVLAATIIAGFPGTAFWALGLLIGIDMIFSGTTLTVLAIYARTSAVTPPTTTTSAAYARSEAEEVGGHPEYPAGLIEGFSTHVPARRRPAVSR